MKKLFNFIFFNKEKSHTTKLIAGVLILSFLFLSTPQVSYAKKKWVNNVVKSVTDIATAPLVAVGKTVALAYDVVKAVVVDAPTGIYEGIRKALDGSGGGSTGSGSSVPNSVIKISPGTNPLIDTNYTKIYVSATNITNCEYGITGKDLGWGDKNGPLTEFNTSFNSGTLTSDKEFKITCYRGESKIGEATTTVIVPPIPFPIITAATTTVANGANTTITWNATSSTNCIITKSVGDNVVLSWTKNNTLATTPNKYIYAPDSQLQGTFSSPTGITVSGADFVYVTDTGNKTFQRFNSTGALVTNIGPAQYTFSNPTNVIPGSGDPDHIYVSDAGTNNRIAIFDNNKGTYTSNTYFGAGLLFQPSAITAINNFLYVVDKAEVAGRIKEFDTDGTFLTAFGSAQLSSPSGIAINKTSSGNPGAIYISDTGHNRIQIFNSDHTPLSTIGGPGSEDGKFTNPQGIAIDSAGNLYVAEAGTNDRIQKFSPDGDFLLKFGSTGSDNSQFNNPEGVTVDSSGNIYVADTGNGKVKKFLPQISSEADSGSITTDTTFKATCDFTATSKNAAVTTSGIVIVSIIPPPVCTTDMNSCTSWGTCVDNSQTCTGSYTIIPSGCEGSVPTPTRSCISLTLKAASSTISKYASTNIIWNSANTTFCTTTKKMGNGDIIVFSTSTSNLGKTSEALASTTVFTTTCTNRNPVNDTRKFSGYAQSVKMGKISFGGNTPTQIANVIPQLAIGDNYQGGKLAYILQSGDPGYDASVKHGLIAATVDQSAGIRWYNGSGIAITSARAKTLGTGLANTNNIVASQGAIANSYAAGLARAYNGGGYSDWYLPSSDELYKLIVNKVAIGGFSNGDAYGNGSYYWSSSEAYIPATFTPGNHAWAISTYMNPLEPAVSGKEQIFRVRAVRSF